MILLNRFAALLFVMFLASNSAWSAPELRKQHTHGVSCNSSVDKQVEPNLLNFHDLDFNVFNHQKFDELGRSHSQDVKVHFPDGSIRVGLEAHAQDLAYLFIWAPDLQIVEHVIEFGRCNYTATIGRIEGTFTQPMPLRDGTFAQPTGKHFNITFATIGRWENRLMSEEYLFWDAEEWSRQMGLCVGPTFNCNQRPF